MSLPEWAKWMARDTNGDLYAYEDKPYKEAWHDEWLKGDRDGEVNGEHIKILTDSYDHIKWSDEEPTEIINMMTNNIQTGDPVNHPSHYNQGGIETLDLIKLYLTPEEYRGYLKGNIIKYRERAQFKGNAEQDYAKAKFYYDEVKEVAE